MINELNSSVTLIIHQTQANARILAIIFGLPWLFYLLTVLSNRRLLLLGIYPRHLWGLLGIVFAPLLHGNFNHLFFNSIPLLVLSNFVLIDGLAFFLWATAIITVASGLLVWCFGKSGLHIGASAVITGYWGLLVSNILQQGTVTAIILGIICIYYFAGIFSGIFPGKKGVSWEGHFFGLISGFGTSYAIPHLMMS